jgi:hypothetical protein
MREDKFLSDAADYLREAVQPYGGTVAVAESPARALEILQQGAPGGFACVLFWTDDSADGEESDADTRLTGTLSCGVTSAQGLRMTPGTGTLLQICGRVRTVLATMEHEELVGQRSPAYRGKRYLAAPGGQLAHGYVLTFGVRYAWELDTLEEGEEING